MTAVADRHARVVAEPVEEVDAIVIGASLRGLIAGHVLNNLGYRAVIVDRFTRIGGSDGSFVTAEGTQFDFGLHLLDHRRSELTTQLLTHAVDGAARATVLQRAIALRGHVVPYAPDPTVLPAELRSLLNGDTLADDIGDDLPTRARLARCYGAKYADLVYDEVLTSFPSESRHRDFGVDEARLLTNIYPWFMPAAAQRVRSSDESRAFHDRLRAGIPQIVLYPERGGFAGFADGLAQKYDRSRIEVITGATDLAVRVEPGTQRVDAVDAGGRRFRAAHYFWADSWPRLCALLDLPCQDAATDRVLLGSFRLNRRPSSPYHEILVGDPDLYCNRVHFPAAFRGTDEALVQVEFAVPRYDPKWSTEPEFWRRRWIDDLRVLGVVDDGHEVEEFDFRDAVLHFNGFGAEGEPLHDADVSLLEPTTNITPVVPSMANLNINRYVARAVCTVTTTLAAAHAGQHVAATTP